MRRQRSLQKSDTKSRKRERPAGKSLILPSPPSHPLPAGSSQSQQPGHQAPSTLSTAAWRPPASAPTAQVLPLRPPLPPPPLPLAGLSPPPQQRRVPASLSIPQPTASVATQASPPLAGPAPWQGRCTTSGHPFLPSCTRGLTVTMGSGPIQGATPTQERVCIVPSWGALCSLQPFHQM